MINAIGAVHAALRAKKKRPEENINFRVEVKKRRRLPQHDDEEEEQHPPQRRRSERGRFGMNAPVHTESLVRRHAVLEHDLDEEMKRPCPDFMRVRQ